MRLETRKNQAWVAVGHTGSVLTITQQKNTANRSRTRLAAQRHWAPAVQIDLNPGAKPRAQQQGLDAATRTMHQGAAEDEFGGSPKKTMVGNGGENPKGESQQMEENCLLGRFVWWNEQKVYPTEGRTHGCGGCQRGGWRAVAEKAVKTEREKK